MRRLAFFALSASVLVAALPTACGGDDSTATGGDASTDAATDSPIVTQDGGASDAPVDAGPLSVGIADVSAYAGASAKLVATPIGTTPTAYAWTVKTVPSGSAITTASLVGANTASPSITPDIVGDYVLEVTATGAGAPAKASGTVHALAAPVFYARAIFDPSGGQVALHAIGHDKSDNHAVACAINVQPTEFTQYRLRTLMAAAGTMDGWEAPAGQPSRYVFSGTASLTPVNDAGDFATFLIAGTTKNSCLVAPTTLRSINAKSGAIGQPRFSPDGSRIAFIDVSGASFGVATVAFDGTGYRAVAPIYASPPSGSDESTNIRPEWQDATHVAWPRPGSGSWQVMVASDAASATPSVYFTCAGASTPHHIAMLGDGSVVASYSPAANAPVDLFVLKPDASKNCQVVKKLTSLSGSGSRAHDFAVSPDQKTVAYLQFDANKYDSGAASNDGELWSVPVDGSKAAAPVGAPRVGRIGPRWIGAGSRLAWTSAGSAADGGNPIYADNVSVILANGTGAADLVNGDGANLIVGAVGPGGSCAIGAGHASRAACAGIALVASIAMLARRRRRARPHDDDDNDRARDA